MRSSMVLAVVIVCTANMFGQSSVLEYDLLRGKFDESISTIRHGESISLRLININPFQYSVTFKGKIVRSQGTMPRAIAGVFSLDKEKVAASAESISKADSAALPRDAILKILPNDRLEKILELRTAVTSQADQLKTYYRKLESLLKLGAEIEDKVRAPFLDEAPVKGSIELAATEVIGRKPTLAGIEFVQEAMRVYDELSTQLTLVEMAYTSLRIAIGSKPDLDEQAWLASARTEFATAKAMMEQLRLAVPRDSCRVIMELAADIYEQVMSTPFSYQSTPFQAVGDRLELQATATPRSERDPLTVLELSRTIEITDYWRMDFSAGVFFHGLENRTYSVLDTTFIGKQFYVANDTARTRDSVINGKMYVQNETGRLAYSTGGLISTYYRWDKALGIGLSVGVLLGGGTDNVQYMGGVSTVIGVDQQFVLTAGVVVGKVSELSSGYRLNTPLATSSNTVPTVFQNRVSWVIGVSYNLGPKSTN